MEQSKKEGLFSSGKDLFYHVVWFFVIGALLGFVMETVLCFIQRGYIESRQGLIYGPFIPVYGFGAVLCLLTLPRIKKIPWLFLTSFLIGGAFEYFCSLFQELVFGTVSWNYENYFLNFDGRTSLFHCLCWGFLGIAFAKVIYPFFKARLYDMEPVMQKVIIWLLTVFMIFNMIISSLAGIRQKERIKKIPPGNAVEVFLDRHYPDSRMDRIYPNKKVVK